MKVRLNLTIDESLLARIKLYSENNKVSISELVEQYFKSISTPVRQQNLIDIVEKLKPVKVNIKKDLKQDFYKEQAGKYRF